MYNNAFREASVFVTGHTGFKGTWLSLYLNLLGANVTGYSLAPLTEPSIFHTTDLQSRIHHHIESDIRNLESLISALDATKPAYIFHLAAQPLVLTSYEEPLETFDVNVMGTLILLEAVRQLKLDCTIVVVATDKVYANQEWSYAYRENDTLGGHDPYSASKAAMEIAVQSYCTTFFGSVNGSSVKLATARAGNVIGGGDWAENRIVPDCIRALQTGNPITLRNPQAVRPWQHVLEPLAGYLWLAAKLSQDESYAGAWNFGPQNNKIHTVSALITAIEENWGRSFYSRENESPTYHETQTLTLSIDKARQRLHWYPIWDFNTTVTRTTEWYRATIEDPEIAYKQCLLDIENYHRDAKLKGVAWAQ